MTLKTYLENKYSSGTASIYGRDIAHYLNRRPNAGQAKYADVLSYLEELRHQQSPSSIHRILQSIKTYYHYLIATKQREDHPCEILHLRDHQSPSIQLQDLFTPTELESLLEKKYRYAQLHHRNQLIISLLIYQGLTTGELIRLDTESLNLDKGQIQLPSSRRLHGRSLSLKPNQILTAYHYQHQDRPKLLKVKTDQLLITQRGTAENGEGISYLVSTQQSRFTNRKLNPKTIRQSVIANLLSSGQDLRKVQLFAGHKYPSSTERYRQTNLDSLKDAIRKHHPLQ